MTDHMTNANSYIDGYTDAYNGLAPRRDDDHYREGYGAGKADANLFARTQPENCRNRLQREGKAYPRSGCNACGTGGTTGCPYEAKVQPQPAPFCAPGEDDCEACQ